MYSIACSPPPRAIHLLAMHLLSLVSAARLLVECLLLVLLVLEVPRISLLDLLHAKSHVIR